MKLKKEVINIQALIRSYPRIRSPLPADYERIYEKHCEENRRAETNASKATALMEAWMHKKVAKTDFRGKTLEIGAGILNQLRYERNEKEYDIVEPNHKRYGGSPYLKYINNRFDFIENIPYESKYDRIISVATYEHIENLPQVIAKTGVLLADGGVIAIAIPNQGRFLWTFAYRCTSGIEFRRRYHLDYEIIMNYEHINTADEIEALLRYMFSQVDVKLFGINRDFSFYRYFECRMPNAERCNRILYDNIDNTSLF